MINKQYIYVLFQKGTSRYLFLQSNLFQYFLRTLCSSSLLKCFVGLFYCVFILNLLLRKTTKTLRTEHDTRKSLYKRRAKRRRKVSADMRRNKDRLCGGETEAVTIFVACVTMLTTPLNLSLFAYMHTPFDVLVWRPGSLLLYIHSRPSLQCRPIGICPHGNQSVHLSWKNLRNIFYEWKNDKKNDDIYYKIWNNVMAMEYSDRQRHAFRP